jgi:hypothetical protein
VVFVEEVVTDVGAVAAVLTTAEDAEEVLDPIELLAVTV